MSSRQIKGMLFNILNLIRLVLKSIFAACVAGTTIAILNVLFAGIEQNSIFGFADIVGLSLYHILVGCIFGTVLGILYWMYSFIRKKFLVISISFLTYFYLFLAIWLFIFFYINRYYLPLLKSFQSIVWNLALFFICIIFFIIIIKYIKIRRLHVIIKIYVIILVIILLFSSLYNINFSIKPKKNVNLVKNQLSNNLNVIIILLDAVRSDHLGCYGYERETSPNIDQLASKGVIFENAFSVAPHTRESVPSLFTSTYPSTHKVRTLSNAIPKNMLILPQIFKLYGYKTSMFSTIGFVSETFGYDRGVDDFFSSKKNLICYTILYEFLKKISEKKIPVVNWVSTNFLTLSHTLFPPETSIGSGDPNHITQKVISWISDNQDKPFFSYIHYLGGHAEYIPPPPYDRLFDPDYPNKPVTNYPQESEMFIHFAKALPMPKREEENMIAQYDGEIFYHDKNLGFLFNHLKKLNLDKKTIIVITADHGEQFYEHNGWGHGNSIYDESIHVPLILYCPGVIPEGKRIKMLVSLVDVFPTLCSLCGISNISKFPYKIEGIDLSPVILKENHKNIREYIFSELYYGNNLSAKCIRTMNYKAIEVNFGKKTKYMLFNLNSDPFEKNNIYDKELKIGIELFKEMHLLVEEAEKRSFKSKSIELDEKMKEHLRSLGYIK